MALVAFLTEGARRKVGTRQDFYRLHRGSPGSRDEDEYIEALLDKLFEEDRHVRRPLTSVSRKGAHVFEVLFAMLAVDGHDASDLIAATEAKHDEHGGFAECWWWEPES